MVNTRRENNRNDAILLHHRTGNEVVRDGIFSLST